MFVAQAAPGPAESTIVLVTPERILDTRNGNDIGLPGPFVSPVGQKLQVTGSIPTATGTKVVVPTGVLLNVTAVGATANGFISIRPGDATGSPSTSSLNVTAGITVPNSVQVSMPTAGANAGKIDITWDALGTVGPTTDMLIDVVGYTTNTGLQQLVADVAAKANAADVYTKAQTGAGYFNQASTNTSFSALAGTEQVLTQVSLPAGSYLVTAKVLANNNSASQQTARCELRLGGITIDEIESVNLASNAALDRAIIALTSGGTLAAPSTASLVCSTNSTSGNWLSRSITVVQVGSLTGSSSSIDPSATAASSD